MKQIEKTFFPSCSFSCADGIGREEREASEATEPRDLERQLIGEMTKAPRTPGTPREPLSSQGLMGLFARIWGIWQIASQASKK